MQKNVSDTEAVVRTIVAIVLVPTSIGWYLLGSEIWGLWVLVVGLAVALVLAATAYARSCPLKSLYRRVAGSPSGDRRQSKSPR